jgi:hypothetical protein
MASKHRWLRLSLLAAPDVSVDASAPRAIQTPASQRWEYAHVSVLVALFPLVFVLLMLVGKLVAPGAYARLIAEDGLVEYATSLAYVVATGFAAVLAIALHRRAAAMGMLYWMLSAGLFLIAMEEISWGQRIFGFETPVFLRDLNSQNEATIHNLAGVPTHALFVVVGSYGAFARMLVPSRIHRRHPVLIDLVTAPRLTFFYFFVPLLLYSYYEYLEYYVLPDGMQWREYFADRFVTGKDQEPIELLLSLGFLLFVLRNWREYGRKGGVRPLPQQGPS